MYGFYVCVHAYTDTKYDFVYQILNVLLQKKSIKWLKMKALSAWKKGDSG